MHSDEIEKIRYEIIKKSIAMNDKISDFVTYKTADDKTFRKATTDQIKKRDRQYTELLSHFVGVTRVRNVLKEIFKWLFLMVIIGAMTVVVILTFLLFQKYLSSASINQITEAVPLLLTSLVGFVSAIIVIPVTITKYLFSTEEDNNITQIILHTQNHDVSGRQWVTDNKETVDKTEKAEVTEKAE